MLKEYVAEFAKYKKLGQKTLEQIPDEALNVIPGVAANSMAMIVRHLHGNLLARFTDFLTKDGEKPWRDRATEFAVITYTRAEVEAYWSAGWTQLEAALAELSENDLLKTVTIKGQAVTADGALCRALAHVAYHVGQLVLLGRIGKGETWEYLSSPRQ